MTGTQANNKEQKMEDINTKRIAILEQRINELETRVSQLENPKPVTGGTLKRAIEVLADKVGQMGETFSNEGRKGRYIIGHDGKRHPVFIAASRNLGSDTGKPMAGWHSINPRNADTSRFDAYILSVEDELRKPMFFIFTPEEFQRLLDSKKADSKGLRHFYISRAEAGMDRFVDWRDGGMDMTQYRGAFNKLEFNA